MAKAAPKLKSSKKRTKGVHSATRLQFDEVDLPKEDDSEAGEQIQESVTQHLLEDDDKELDAELAEIAQVAEERGNREDTESEDEPSIKRRKFDNERDESVGHATSEDNDSDTDIVPPNNIPSVFDVNIEPRRKRKKYNANVGNEDSDSADDFVQTKAKKIAKAASKLKTPKKRGKGIQWETRFTYDNEDYPFFGSDIDIKLKTEYLRHKTSRTKVGQSVIYWCKYGKRIGFNCPVQAKTLRINKKVLYMEPVDGKDHDHTENRKARVYEHYSTEKLDAIKEGIRLDLKPRYIKKSLKSKELVCDETMPSISSLYHKFNRVRRDDCTDQVKITVAQFKQLLEDNSIFPENAHETFVGMHWVDEYAGEHADDLKYVVIISTPALITRFLCGQNNDWCLLVDGTYGTNIEGAPLVLFGANTFKTGKQIQGIGVVFTRYCNVFYCTILYCTVLNFIALYCTVLFQ